MIEREFNVTGFTVKAAYTEYEVKKIFNPLLNTLTALREEKGKRLVVYLSAPPGAGKTTLSLFLEELYKEQNTPYTFQSVSMDGFHHYNAYLDSHYTKRQGEDTLLRKIKGSPETFDFENLEKKIIELTKNRMVKWPIYDRSLHGVSDETIKVDADIVLLEGNYLLLNSFPWNKLTKHCDYSIFIDTNLDTLTDRLISRKQQGESTYDEAKIHFDQTDRVNAELVLSQSQSAALNLYLTEEKQVIENN